MCTDPKKTHGLNTICKMRTSGLTPSKLIAPIDIIPCLSMSCAAALVITVNRMKPIYFMSVPLDGGIPDDNRSQLFQIVSMS
jgi:hypothetical protein